ncbi:hypothetical protein AVEN_60815-1 [Araneus ventricosus]|uniref:Uncharacterized protein n=1 Tax=Araneus ventricosus TaxID=182803 RepID=A0A4Y2H9K1_ARAVE|nr:hypothetical protein AVEN_60815-1 [Araneus ventricosus]
MRKSAENAMSNCIECILLNKKRGKGEGILNPIPKESIESFIEDRENFRKEANKNILKIQEENRGSYNKKRNKPHQYKVGDFVQFENSANTDWD